MSTAFVLLFMLSNTMVSNQLLGPLENKFRPHEIQLPNKRNISTDTYPVKFIVVLGGGHTTNPQLPVTSQIKKTALVRLIEGIRIQRKYPDSKLILSGGIVFDPIPHAMIMADIASELGIDENDIIIEAESRDTKDEAMLIKSIVKDERFVLVTSASHMPRSMALFKKLGMTPVAAPTAHLVKNVKIISPISFFPSASNLDKSKRAFYEYLGITWAKLRRQI
jgi:uncharacterized SAM-binding protein YcdF (DUF218 family)